METSESLVISVAAAESILPILRRTHEGESHSGEWKASTKTDRTHCHTDLPARRDHGESSPSRLASLETAQRTHSRVPRKSQQDTRVGGWVKSQVQFLLLVLEESIARKRWSILYCNGAPFVPDQPRMHFGSTELVSHLPFL
eukprot:1030739-Rhodomonas_salina.1